MSTTEFGPLQNKKRDLSHFNPDSLHSDVATIDWSCIITVKPGQAYPPKFHQWIYYSKVESVGSCRFQYCMRNEPWIHTRFSYEISTSSHSFPKFDVKVFYKNFNSVKDFQSDQMQISSRKLFTAHYACRNLNLTPVTGHPRRPRGR